MRFRGPASSKELSGDMGGAVAVGVVAVADLKLARNSNRGTFARVEALLSRDVPSKDPAPLLGALLGVDVGRVIHQTRMEP